MYDFLSSEGAGSSIISVHIQPRSAKNELSGIHGGRLKIRICAPPVEGEANKQCINFLSNLLGVAKSDITLVRGVQSRRKTFRVEKPVEFVEMKLKRAGLVG